MGFITLQMETLRVLSSDRVMGRMIRKHLYGGEADERFFWNEFMLEGSYNHAGEWKVVCGHLPGTIMQFITNYIKG